MIVYFNSIGPVTFFRNRRSKNIKISVKQDKSVLVSFPHFASEKEVLAFLAQNEAWILKQKEKMKTLQKVFQEGPLLKTKLHSVELIRGTESGRVEQSGNVIRIVLDDFETEKSRNFIKNVVTKIYRHEAQAILPSRLRELARLHGFFFNKVTVRNNKRNWGSCSPANNISLNLNMMKLPDELIDYILLHELVHTKIKNHSSSFWEELNLHTQNKARELARQVKKYPTYT